MESSPQVCPICQVSINPSADPAEEVRFSSGMQASRTKLWARVCQFAKGEGCINTDPSLLSTPTKTDFFGEAPSIEMDGDSPKVNI
ncbi:MAG: hypothetical protein CBB79_00265 [Synechococcus sp. TMED19]|nr:MAG: hypothetical protein CBB79_00265 [Synechococcus sp. TMED19]